MTNLLSRLLVGALGLPLVLGLVWLGGWWLYALVLVAGVVAVHEFVSMARTLRPLAPAAYVGVVLGLSGARTGGLVWMLGGVSAGSALQSGSVLNTAARMSPTSSP